jgi:S-adenosyl-L-methionine hydrolase (adenosine-forming)
MVITFLSDYGLEDDFVGVCHAVIAGIAPDVRVIDLTHGVSRHDVRAGALILRGAVPYLPVGVHLAVVDPDVGAQRRAVALRTADGRLLVGPDNGVLSLAAARAGGVTEAVDISRSQFRLQPVSATFHGRDIFAPVAARLAGGAPLSEAGERWDPDQLVAVELPPPRRDEDAIVVQAIYVDRFGNVQLSAGHDQLAGFGLKLGHRVELQIGDRGPYPAHYVRTFADVEPDHLLLYEDGDRQLAVAISHGDAATRLGLRAGEELRIKPE